jgi:uncharacterized protein YjbJ (UPF0337 family)
MRDRVMGTTHDVTEAVHEKAGNAASAPSDAMEAIRSNTSGAPLVAGGIAFGFGMLVGSLIPPSRTEQRMGGQAKQMAEPVKQELREAGRQMADDLKGPVTEAVADVKQTAQEGVQDVRRTAGDAAQDVRTTTTAQPR